MQYIDQSEQDKVIKYIKKCKTRPLNISNKNKFQNISFHGLKYTFANLLIYKNDELNIYKDKWGTIQ